MLSYFFTIKLIVFIKKHIIIKLSSIDWYINNNYEFFIEYYLELCYIFSLYVLKKICEQLIIS